jgi:hypothetical protein
LAACCLLRALYAVQRKVRTVTANNHRTAEGAAVRKVDDDDDDSCSLLRASQLSAA